MPPNPAALPPPANTPAGVVPLKKYEGNNYDLYALLAGVLGSTTLAMCFTGNFILYCLPIAPLVLGIIALRNAHASVDPQRTRNLAWIGIGGGAIGTIITLCFILFFVLYFSFIIAFIANGIPNLPRRP